jgi:hypothetical protein
MQQSVTRQACAPNPSLLKRPVVRKEMDGEGNETSAQPTPSVERASNKGATFDLLLDLQPLGGVNSYLILPHLKHLLLH